MCAAIAADNIMVSKSNIIFCLIKNSPEYIKTVTLLFVRTHKIKKGNAAAPPFFVLIPIKLF